MGFNSGFKGLSYKQNYEYIPLFGSVPLKENRSSSLCSFLRPYVTSSPLGSKHSSQRPDNISHTHTKQKPKLQFGAYTILLRCSDEGRQGIGLIISNH